MADALLAGVSGMKAFQQMINVAGNNLANVNTTSFKSSRVGFAELLSEKIREASKPSGTSGGANPIQIGSGVAISSIDRLMTQGSLVNTGQPLDMAIDGSGYFCLSNGQTNVYTRSGGFAVDSNYNLVDPSTGYLVQRIGSEGVAEGFQAASSNDIRIPYDVALPAKATENISFTGNLSADENSPTTNIMTSGTAYMSAGGVCSETTLLTNLDLATAGLVGKTITVTGTRADGTAASGTLTVGAGTTVGDLLTAINTAFGGQATASLSSGEIRLTDAAAGYSQTDMQLSVSDPATLALPSYFKMLQAGGQASKNVNVEIYDSQGVGHIVNASFVKSNTANQWDMVITSVTGDVSIQDRRIKGVTFLSDGSYGGLTGSDISQFQLTFAHDPTNVRTVRINMGTTGEFDGLSQFGSGSTVAASGQDGYASGWLSSLSVSRDGTLVGVFTNGVRQNVASLKIATFQNPSGLEDVGNNYFIPSGNSGESVPTKALSGGAGSVTGGALEKSNVDVAAEFVNLIQAQNGFQANARTIRVTNEMLQELTNLIR